MKCRHFIANQNRRDCKLKVSKVQVRVQADHRKRIWEEGYLWEYCKKDEECMICYEPNSPKKAKVQLNGCTHSLCLNCVRKLFKTNQERCPMCRATFTDKSTLIYVRLRDNSTLMQYNSGLMFRTLAYIVSCKQKYSFYK